MLKKMLVRPRLEETRSEEETLLERDHHKPLSKDLRTEEHVSRLILVFPTSRPWGWVRFRMGSAGRILQTKWGPFVKGEAGVWQRLNPEAIQEHAGVGFIPSVLFGDPVQ